MREKEEHEEEHEEEQDITKSSTEDWIQYADNLKYLIVSFYDIPQADIDNDPDRYEEVLHETEREVIDYNNILRELARRGVHTGLKPLPSIKSENVVALKTRAS